MAQHEDPSVPDTEVNNGKDKREANTCMALGAGVGILGATSAALTGAVCPLCIFVAPGLIGLGAFKRWQCSRDPEGKPKK